MTSPRFNSQHGFALLLALVFVALLSLSLSSLLSSSERSMAQVTDARSSSQVRAAAMSGVDFAESQIRKLDFTLLLKGLNGIPDSSAQAARAIAFRMPLTRAFVTSNDWETLRYGDPDDGLIHDGVSIMNPSGLLLNQSKLFFKVTNNPDDPGGPFLDTDDIVLLRVLAAIPTRLPFFGTRAIRNLSEIVEVTFRRNTTFLGPAAVYCPSGRLLVDLTLGGLILGRAEIGTGGGIAAAEPIDVRTTSGDQIDGNPVIADLGVSIYADPRLRWLTEDTFVGHWKSRISSHVSPSDLSPGSPALHWAPNGLDLSANETLQGIVFAQGPVILRQSARIEGLLILMDSAGLQLFDSASISGSVTAVGKGGLFPVILHDEARISYTPSLVSADLRLLPLARIGFRFITPEMEP